MKLNTGLENLQLFQIHIPFRQGFKHASAQRQTTESICVFSHGNSHSGVGEGCPREYVTGETIESCQDFFYQHRQQWYQDIQQLPDLYAWVAENSGLIDANPAVWCAVELAILDLFARQQQLTIEQLLNIQQTRDVFNYSAILDASDLQTYQSHLQRYRTMGFVDFKIKVDSDTGLALAKLALLQKSATEKQTIRLDANNLWPSPADAIAFMHSCPPGIMAIEEPLTVNQYEEMLAIYQQTDIPIILDESFLSITQLSQLAINPQAWILNLRVSKLGGILRAMEIIVQARQLQIPIIVGAQVGETSILSRAAMVLAQACGNSLLAQEGSFGTHLLQQELTQPCLMFGQQGKLQLPVARQRGDGLGLSVDADSPLLQVLGERRP